MSLHCMILFISNRATLASDPDGPLFLLNSLTIVFVTPVKILGNSSKRFVNALLDRVKVHNLGLYTTLNSIQSKAVLVW